MHIALTDDRPDALAKLSETLNEYAGRNGLHFDLHTYSGGEELLEALSSQHFSLIFLDVYMNGISGIETAARIREIDEEVCLVFLTTSNEHQAEAIHWHVYDYINKDEGPEAVFRVMDRLLRGHIRDTFPTLRFTAGKTEISLPYSDLVCLTADRNYLVIHSRQKKEYRTRMTLSSVWSKLEQDGRFLQVLRGVIVNMDYITDIADNTCCLQGDLRLPVSVRNRATIEQLWTDYTFSRIRRESMAEGGIRP
ncbi:LytR/AlgR family response regulator transcription factor [Aristaeella hokkaidonensis]|uniref:Response regulator transcription factor n=1 Tax=Aristaeella hokkaidonensis TaxID=3046382 RepID=A0AC61MW76_9FIRM|nr:LytTR family DNA-binding domain-containing protein [Aristaeella hokkaidonensis]QUC66955.1 response regulator transcription factor [Aristaeella hokkaidonensis]SNT94412.1 two component transcriptional regulator, LytTR family [Aristaeella hokkaidonensis]